MSVVAAYHIFVCALFLVQGGMWTGFKLIYNIRLMHLLVCNTQ
jgi:hypothetical protein